MASTSIPTEPRAPGSADQEHMRAALALARRGLGRVWPNPAVGCIVVAGEPGRVVGRGWTQPGGRPHAETEALARAGELARGGTAYVSLEPCSHTGRTPPCAEALVASGIARVVVAIEDPDPRVAGAGLARLRTAGLDVVTGVLASEAAALNAGFFLRLTARRPLVTLKTATTLDGRIATAGGDSRWITGEPARRRGHLLRASHDAIMVGTETALRDNPELTCRLPGLGDRSPVRVLLDRTLRVPATAKLLADANKARTWVVVGDGADPKRRAALADAGVEILVVDEDGPGRLDPRSVLQALAARGITRLLVEGGGALAGSLLKAGLVDRIAWFRAPSVIGGDGSPAVAALALPGIGDALGFRRVDIERVGGDILETYARDP